MDDELPKLVLPLDERDHVIGPLSAKYTLVEYGDYESPECRNVIGTVRELIRELGDDLCFAYRSYPQPKRYPRAQFAAEAAEAAGFQAKFWLMHDRIFDHQGALSDHDLTELARGLPVDMTVYERDLASGEARDRVNEDMELADEDGVGDTPTFFVNGTMYTGQYEFLPLLEALKSSASRAHSGRTSAGGRFRPPGGDPDLTLR
ncbi:MAG TPA: thioredoxin domain-containing protein [Thermoplasmata archaeon]|nr:thioredoxin domain-containing protein [Thermoplasmata archaeon]